MKKLFDSPWFFILFTAACLLPFFTLTIFNHPSADDFTVTYSLKVKGFWDAQVNWYLKWSGRYISTALVSLLHPLVYKSFFLYRLYPVLLLSGTLWSVNHLLKNLLTNLTTTVRWAMTSIGTVSMLSILPSIVEGFYWVPGSLIYMLANIFTILFSSFLLQYERTKAKGDFFLFLLFGILALGSNELNMFIILSITGIWLIVKYLTNKKRNFIPLCVFTLFLIASSISLFAPGNSARGSVIEKNHLNDGLKINDFLFSISKSLSHGSDDLVNWVLLSPLFVIFLFILLRYNEIRIQLKPIFHPILVWAGIVGLFFFLYFPYYFGTGNPDSSTFPLRTSNVICFYICFTFPIATLYSLKWAEETRQFKIPQLSSTLAFQGMSLAFVLIILFTGNVKMALKDIRSRDFLAYHRELNSRYELIAQSKLDTLLVDSLHFFPRTIYMGDVSGDPENWKNAPYADYFGKKLIRLKNSKDAEVRP